MLALISLRLWFRVLTDVRRRWGNMPATDVINLACNEKDSTRDFSLAYIGMYPMNFSLYTIADGTHH